MSATNYSSPNPKHDKTPVYGRNRGIGKRGKQGICGVMIECSVYAGVGLAYPQTMPKIEYLSPEFARLLSPTKAAWINHPTPLEKGGRNEPQKAKL